VFCPGGRGVIPIWFLYSCCIARIPRNTSAIDASGSSSSSLSCLSVHCAMHVLDRSALDSIDADAGTGAGAARRGGVALAHGGNDATARPSGVRCG
jgi:hypothetical protein